jgi:hypothetical protein
MCPAATVGGIAGSEKPMRSKYRRNSRVGKVETSRELLRPESAPGGSAMAFVEMAAPISPNPRH